MDTTPVGVDDAHEYIRGVRPQHRDTAGSRFAVGLLEDGILAGVAVVGPPKREELRGQGLVVQVTDLVLVRVRDPQLALELLWAACETAAKGLGYKQLLKPQPEIADYAFEPSVEGPSARRLRW